MQFEEFEKRASEVFQAVPESYRRGITTLVIHRERRSHPQIPDFVTLGECIPEPFSEEGAEFRSAIHLYHGSFALLARREPNFPFDEELKETILHEIQHHLEDRAGVGHLNAHDFAEEHNEKRLQGLPFDPSFYRLGDSETAGEFWVGRDCFLEVSLTTRQWNDACQRGISVTWSGEDFRVPVPERPILRHFISLASLEEGGELWIVLRHQGSLFS